MKKIILCLFLIVSVISCKKEPNANTSGPDKEPELTFTNSLKPVVFDYTSTGCPGCGSWGKPTFSALVKDYGNDIIPVAVHIKYGDPMITAISEAIAANRYGQWYTPQIWINDTNGMRLIAGSISSEASIEKMHKLIGSSNSETIALVAGKVIEKEGNKEKIIVGIQSKKTDLNGEYYLSCYLMHDGFIYQQASSATNPTTHNHVIKKAAGDAWGEKVEWKQGSFQYSYSFDDEAINVPHHYVAILWQKTGNRYSSLGGFRFE